MSHSTCNEATFYESLARALHNYLKAKLNIETSEMSKERISQLLKERNVSGEVVSEFIELLKRCEFARYAGSSKGSIQSNYDIAVQSLSSIDKLFK